MSEEKLTTKEISERLLRVSIKDPEHLKQWLDESGRRYLVFDSMDLVDSLPFPDGIEYLMQVIACYRDHRVTKQSGRVEIQKDMLGKEQQIPIMKSDILEAEEIDRVIRFLVGQITTIDPSWSLENPSLQ